MDLIQPVTIADAIVVGIDSSNTQMRTGLVDS